MNCLIDGLTFHFINPFYIHVIDFYNFNSTLLHRSCGPNTDEGHDHVPDDLSSESHHADIQVWLSEVMSEVCPRFV